MVKCAVHVILLIGLAFAKGSEVNSVEDDCTGGQCKENRGMRMLQQKGGKGMEPMPATEEWHPSWQYDGDTVEGRLTNYTQQILDQHSQTTNPTFPMEETDLQKNAMNSIGKHLAGQQGTEGAVYRGCLQFVQYALKKRVPDYADGPMVDKFVDVCKSGVFSEENKILADWELIEECDRVGDTIRMLHKLMGPKTFDSPRRFCTVVVTGALPLESEPTCMRLIEDITAKVFLLEEREKIPEWPEIIMDPKFDEGFMQACLAGHSYIVAEDGACRKSLASLKSANVTKSKKMVDFWGQVCPAVGLPLPVPSSTANYQTLRSHALMHFGHASRHEKYQYDHASLEHGLELRRAHTKGVLERMETMDESAAGKNWASNVVFGTPPTRRRRRWSERHRLCCAEQGLAMEAGVEGSYFATVELSVGAAKGWSRWTHDEKRGDWAKCNYIHSPTWALCLAGGADVGADFGYDQGIFYKYDYIPGCSKYLNAEAAYFVGLGYSIIFACVDFNAIAKKRGYPMNGFDRIGAVSPPDHHIGHYVHFNAGFGVDFSMGVICGTWEHGTKTNITVQFGNTKANDCAGVHCFPAGSTVQTPTGTKPIEDLRVGEKVLTVGARGDFVFEDVYFFGHADHQSEMAYIQFKIEATGRAADASEMFVSSDHFMVTCPLSQTECYWSERVQKYAGSLSEGDFVWVHSVSHGGETPATLRLARLIGKSLQTKRGKFNPYTLSGLVIVDGLVASAHSSWVLDSWTPNWLTQYLPAVYQALFLPGRLLYGLAGPRAADWLDMNNPQRDANGFGYGPTFLLSVFVLKSASILSIVKLSKWMCVRTQVTLTKGQIQTA